MAPDAPIGDETTVSYSVKELLGDLNRKLDTITNLLNKKADHADLQALELRTQTESKAMELRREQTTTALEVRITTMEATEAREINQEKGRVGAFTRGWKVATGIAVTVVGGSQLWYDIANSIHPHG